MDDLKYQVNKIQDGTYITYGPKVERKILAQLLDGADRAKAVELCEFANNWKEERGY